ncbi:MAG: MBOAT family protein [Bacteroidales bacterium]|jgi:D-alanyl-lipoteichoic acid acyltransferase DltB (MBOAT superfamily)|nr:MBOAT family protein [Bacteroidales bacterium]
MIFTHVSFWVFFMAVMLLYSFLYQKNPIRNAFLFAVSVYFYYKCGGYYFSLLLISVLINYLAGRSIEAGKSATVKKAVLFAGITFNLLLLAYFKYAYLLVEWVNHLFGASLKVHNLLADWTNRISGSHFDAAQIMLPVGISFFTFQAISYIVDVYRKKTPAVRNLPDFGCYLSFFPQLVAGPIVRAAEFIPQMYRRYRLQREEFGRALFFIGSGLVKKILVSDYISVNFVDRVFDQPALYSGFENLMAVYGYTLQIYCDFSGYTDIAAGVALLMGFQLPLNFNSPYHAVNISDFWRRWHMSLSAWLRDYLYIPLGGNRKGNWRTYINLMITMLLGGLWHGANIRFLLWGALHGLALVLHKAWTSIFPPAKKKRRAVSFAGLLLTFHFTAFCWIFFRADDMDTVTEMIRRIFSVTPSVLLGDMMFSYNTVFAVIFAGFLAHWLPAQWKEYVCRCFVKTPVAIQLVLSVLVFLLIYQTKSSAIQPFVYFLF